MSKNIIIFRVDSSDVIGAGHIMRCLNLAEYCAKYNNKCNIHFICNNFKNSLMHIAETSNYQVHQLHPKFHPTSDINSWLGNDWNNDALQSLRIIKNIKKNSDMNILMIIDHYTIDCKWENLVLSELFKTKYNIKLMVIDDLYNRMHQCDILLDQNCDNPEKYHNLVPKDCQILTGYKYVIINDNILHLKPRIRTSISHVLISFGGYANDFDLVKKICNIMTSESFINIKFHLVMGQSTIIEKVKSHVAIYTNIQVYGFIDFSDLLDRIDLTIGAIGSSIYERCYLGIPSIGFTIADNQKELAHNLDKIGIIQYLGHNHQWDNQCLYDYLMKCLTNLETLSNKSQNCINLIDGLGKQRIYKLISIILA